MKLVLRKPITIRGKHHRPGDTVEVEYQRLALQLVRTGYGVLVEEPPTPQESIAEEEPSGKRKRRRKAT